MSLRDKLGICQWFHFEDYLELQRTVKVLQDLNILHFRTGISWADFYRPGGKQWYDYQMSVLQKAGVEVLLSVWHTPPSISEGDSCSSPPRRLQDYADFIDLVITEYGSTFSALELWNEPNNRRKWDFERYDHDWSKLGAMLAMAGNWARKRGKTTVLGGMIPVDHHWLQLMEDYGALQFMDIIAIHGFPGMWWDDEPNWEWYTHWKGWSNKINSLQALAGHRPIWITETGLATWNMKDSSRGLYDLQSKMLLEAIEAPAERVYWYSTIDLNPHYEAIEGFHVDENEYHLGLVQFSGTRKPAYELFTELLETGQVTAATKTNKT